MVCDNSSSDLHGLLKAQKKTSASSRATDSEDFEVFEPLPVASTLDEDSATGGRVKHRLDRQDCLAISVEGDDDDGIVIAPKI